MLEIRPIAEQERVGAEQDVKSRGQAGRARSAEPPRDPPDNGDGRQDTWDRHQPDRQLAIAADRDPDCIEPVAKWRLVLRQVAIHDVALKDPMPDVGIGRLVAVQGLALTDCHGPEVHSRRSPDIRSKRMRAVPDVERHQEDQDQDRPSHRSGCSTGLGALVRRFRVGASPWLGSFHRFRDALRRSGFPA